jgi:hypothetical protein
LNWDGKSNVAGKLATRDPFIPAQKFLIFQYNFTTCRVFCLGINLTVWLSKVWLLILLEWRALAVFELRFRAKTSSVGRILFSCVEG